MSLFVTPVTDLDTLSLVQPHRLGRLLSQVRTERRIGLAELSLASGGAFAPEELAAIEAGRVVLCDTDIAGVAQVYGVGAHALVPQRTRLVIDLDEGQLSTGHARSTALPGRPDRRAERTADDLLTRYLSLVYTLRGLAPGVPLSLRHDDLEVLAGALGRSLSDVERRLALLMADPSDRVARRVRHLLARVAVPAAGIFVGTVPAAALVLEPRPGDPPPGAEFPEAVSTGLVLSLARRIADSATDGTPEDDADHWQRPPGRAVPAASDARR